MSLSLLHLSTGILKGKKVRGTHKEAPERQMEMQSLGINPS